MELGAEEGSPTAGVEVRLAEFASLRQETNQRSSFQHALMALNLTVVGTIFGLVLDSHAERELLLVIPVVSPTLGLLWLDHHHNIARIARYVRSELWIWTPSWETWIRRPSYEHRRWWHHIFWNAIRLLFWGAPLAILAAGVPVRHRSLGAWVIWAIGLVLTSLCVFAFLNRSGARGTRPPGSMQDRTGDPYEPPRRA